MMIPASMARRRSWSLPNTHRATGGPLAEPIYVGRDMWEQIVSNLLSNPLKFTLQGEIASQVAASN